MSKKSHKSSDVCFETPTYWVIIGESGTGKTYYAQELLETVFRKSFHQIVFVAETFHSSSTGSWLEFYRHHNLAANKNVVVIDNLDDVKEFRNAAIKVKSGKGKLSSEDINKARFYDPSVVKKPLQTLWIFDDYLGAIKKNTKDDAKSTSRTYSAIVHDFITEMVINGRHRNLSAMVLCQEAVGIKPTTRRNAHMITYFPTSIRTNIERLSAFYSLVKRKKDMINILLEIGHAKPHITQSIKERSKNKKKKTTHKYEKTPKNYFQYCKFQNVYTLRINWKTIILNQKTVNLLCDKMDYRGGWIPYGWLTSAQKKHLELS